MTIRTATPLDADAIAQVQVASWRAAYKDIVPDEHLDGLDWREWAALRRERLSHPGEVRTCVAALEETSRPLVGFVASGPGRDGARDSEPVREIYAIYVSPSAWGGGVGRALLERALTAGPTDIPVTLWVLSANIRAREFYEKQGFRVDGAVKTIAMAGRELLEVRYRLQRTGQVAKPSDR